MGRQLSAKDKAFQKERERLMKQAENYRQLVITRDGQLYEKDKKIEELEQQIANLHKQIEEHFHMTPEQFDEHIHRDMRGVEAIEYLRAMAGRFGGMYNV
jgi:chromosome segregation ATPase